MSQLPAILIHGGAWAIPEALWDRSVAGVRAAAKGGYQLLMQGGSAVDAVDAAVRMLEDDPAFDAGTGSVLNSKEEIEMDAMIMNGETLSVGSVACVQKIKHPVQLARLVMEKSDHTMLVGQGADEYGKEMGIPQVTNDDLLTDEARMEYQQYLKFRKVVDVDFSPREKTRGHDTVGAVAVDCHGNVACATSTGGITAKRPGRVGDSPLVGCGGFADNDGGAVSTTGHGEAITKVCLAHHIVSLMKQGLGAQSAAEAGISHMKRRVQGCGGVIVVSPSGELGHASSTEKMAWASVQGNQLKYGIHPDEDCEEICELADGNI